MANHPDLNDDEWSVEVFHGEHIMLVGPAGFRLLMLSKDNAFELGTELRRVVVEEAD